jgi:hypothetical protein
MNPVHDFPQFILNFVILLSSHLRLGLSDSFFHVSHKPASYQVLLSCQSEIFLED